MTFLYKVGVAAFRYEEVTLFDKTEETRPEHSLNIATSVNQPWGEISGSLEMSSFLDDFSKHRSTCRRGWRYASSADSRWTFGAASPA